MTTVHSPLAISEAVQLTVSLGPPGSVPTLDRISLAIMPDEVLAILGPSGCGKSTLLRALVGLLPPTQGQVLAHGEPLSGIHPGIAIVFQNFALFPWLTVRENVELALSDSPLDAAARAERVQRCLELVGLAGNEATYPKELSGGMRQRVGIARALARDPELLCMDEPFSALDVFTAESLRSEIYNLWVRWKSGESALHRPSRLKSILMITHIIEEAVFLADRIVIMGTRPGCIRRIIVNPLAHPRDYRSPAFLELVQQIHQAIVTEHLPDTTEPTEPLPATQPLTADSEEEVEPIPLVEIGEIFGLLEVLHDHQGRVNVFTLHDLTTRDFGHTLAVVMAAEMLDFLETPKEVVSLTELGRRFLAADIHGRKALFRQQLLLLPLFRFVVRRLQQTQHGSLAKEFLLEDLVLWLSTHEVEPLFDKIVAWGRFAEILAFDRETEMLTLVEPNRGER